MTALSGWIGNRADQPATIQITDDLAAAFVANPAYDDEANLHGQILNWLAGKEGQNLAWDPDVYANLEAIEDLYHKIRTIERARAEAEYERRNAK